ncbi:neuropeptides capa receptor-like [Leptopilina heterotoma]|uniref:neuropeptides capa receptor-like n=1 Tax=Leptopilina heterotoma TaxID=63436 RepID=UPI001CA9FCB2|nr:neuropeptides capa receptor-like [Leptopilina heterotoma]
MEDISELELLNSALGPQRLPLIIAVPLNLIYIIIFFIGVVGNLATCMVTIKNSSMQNVTNYYLFSLAVSDLLLLIIGMPIDIMDSWHRYPWPLGSFFCKLSHYILEMSCNVSVLTIMAFSLERYVAICHPFRLQGISGLKRPTIVIFCCWLGGIITAIPTALNSIVSHMFYWQGRIILSEKSAVCATRRFQYPYLEISFVLFFLVPMILITILYIKMGLKIHRSTNHKISEDQHSNSFEPKQLQARKSIIKMLCAVVVTFFVCWAPFHTQRIYSIYSNYKSDELFILSGLSYYMSTAANPILYNVMSTRYRAAFKETICCITISVKIKRTTTDSSKQTENSICENIV